MANLNHLRYFFYCAQSGSVSDAAKKLEIAQPSLSAQLKKFENEIGFKLFIRTGRGLQLTPRGETLVKKTSILFEVVRVGVTEEIERPFLSDIIGQLIKSQSSKKISTSIISKTHDEIVELAHSNDLDIIISDRKISGLNFVDEYKIPVMLVSSKNFMGTKVQQIFNASHLLKSLEQVIVQPADDLLLGIETKAFFKKAGIKAHVAVRSNILACIVRSPKNKLEQLLCLHYM